MINKNEKAKILKNLMKARIDVLIN